jgi:hypothetical protein
MSRDFEVLTTKRLRSAEKPVKHQRFQSPLKIASTLAPPDSTALEIAMVETSAAGKEGLRGLVNRT